MTNKIKEIYSYRELLKTNVQKEIRGKYKGAWLGVLWSFLNPLLQLLVYSIIFPIILKFQIPHYPVFLFVALIPWTFFTNAITQGATCIIQDANIIKKVYFPREILPISVVAGAAVNFLISCAIIVAVLLISGMGISWHIILLPVIVLVQTTILLGIDLIISALTVYLQDLQHLISVAIMMLFYATPIVYTLESIPQNFIWVFYLNPMASIITAYRDIFYYQQMPNMLMLGLLFLIGLVLIVIGMKIFDKLQRNFAEEL